MKNQTIELNEKVSINLGKLIESRLLIQANSGGGKSWANRRVIEQSFGKVQIIVIDPEGEFGNMRGKYDFVYIGKDGDAPADSRSAALLARRLLETNASAIIDIYEMSMPERKHYVRLFLEAMVNAPKELWHDCIVILDEAHKFAPEKEQSEALEAVADMASRGRKRGYCLIPATQRPAKLNKDVAAECNNKLIGRASLDIDRKRSAEELGFTTKEEILSLRNLEPGEFYAFGPAIGRDVIKTVIGGVNVKPPKRGEGRKNIPAPTEKVKKMLEQFKDLPEEAKKEADTLQSLTARNIFLEREVKSHKCPVGPDPEKIREEAEKLVQKAKIDIEKSFDEELRRFKKKVVGLKETILKVSGSVQGLVKLIVDLEEENVVANVQKPVVNISIPKQQVASRPMSSSEPVRQIPRADMGDSPLGACERKVYSFLYQNQDKAFSKVQVGVITGYSPTSGGFNNALSRLNSLGLISRTNNALQIASADASLVSQSEEFSAEPRFWESKLGACERKVYGYLWDRPNEAVSKENLGAETGYSSSSGGFNNALSHLNSIGLIRRSGGCVQLNPEILNLG